jgi:tRNA A-37 threonylcarbamoyl transferase component Bud32
LAQYFPQLEIVGLLGQGGMGAVYKARQVKLDRQVALKILPPRPGQDPAFAERFMREARALARVNHPHIVGVHDFGEAGGMYYFLMEYVDGVNLRQLMQSGRLAPEQALPIVGQICDALQYAHDEGIIHRDIKPENILLDQRGRVKIADFGLAKLVGPKLGMFTLTGSQQAMGTPHYMAPEQIERPQTVDQRADIYSLGVLFYEMLTGELPLGHFALPSQKAAVDERLDAVVLRALERDPERRYQRVSELKTDITGQSAMVAPAASAGLARSSYQDEVDQEFQRFQVVGPGASLVFAGILVFVNLTALLAWGLVEDGFYRVGFKIPNPSGGPPTFVRTVDWERIVLPALGWVLVIFLTVVIISGARRMMKFENYGLAVVSSFLPVVASFPCLFWIATHGLGPLNNLVTVLACVPYAFIVGLAVGIWSLNVLRKPEVKLIFARKAVRVRLSTPPTTPQTGTAFRRMRSVIGALRSFVVGSRVQQDPATRSPSAEP